MNQDVAGLNDSELALILAALAARYELLGDLTDRMNVTDDDMGPLVREYTAIKRLALRLGEDLDA